MGIGGAYGHKFIKIFMDELVWRDGVVKHYGMKGLSYGAQYWRWENVSVHNYLIGVSNTHARWLHIDMGINLSNNEASPERSEDSYNPA